MKLTNYDGTEASQKAYNIQESINLIRNETIPALQRNEYNLTDEENAERIANLRKYLNRLQYDLALEIGNNDAWQKTFIDMTLYDYNVDKHQVFDGNPNHLIVDASKIGLPPFFPNWISTNDIGNGNPFYSDKIIREMVGQTDSEIEDIMYGDVECYVYKQNGGGTVLLVVNDAYNAK